MNSKTGQDDRGGRPGQAGDNLSLLSACETQGNIVRKSFRVPVPEGLVTLNLGGQQHQVKDLSMYGVGLSVDNPKTFAVGSVLKDVRIVFPDQSFLVDIRVVHISAYEGDTLICGLEIVNTHDSGYIDWMTRVISEIKTSVLSTISSS